jgi:hypothetical protein
MATQETPQAQVEVTSLASLRAWLEENHATSDGVWGVWGCS